MFLADFRSDTVTHPTPEMREAMFHADVGDDVYKDDPTTNRLEQIAAQILGTEDALFVPSGTMGNQLAMMTHTAKGQEAIVSRSSHIFEHEVGAAAALSSLNLNPLDFIKGIYEPEKIEKAIRSHDIHEPPTGLICLENSLANGRVVPLEIMRQIKKLAESHNIPVHLDGARVFNAATALGIKAKEIVSCVDSVSCCLSKGLCAPIGSVLCGSRSFIKKARKFRKMLGGGMRQTGIIAAAGIIAITKMTERLDDDHANAKLLAKKLVEIPEISLEMDGVQTNMVFAKFDWPHMDKLQSWLGERGVKICGPVDSTIRFVTHNGITKEEVTNLANLLKQFGSEK